MLDYYNDDKVFIRSFGSRGSKGGLSDNINEIADIFSIASYDVIIFETVGVGQIEIDVVEQVDSVVLTLVPESGDDIQMLKAGIIEIADIFVINKSDRSDADKLFTSLQKMLSLVNIDKNKFRWNYPIIKTIATKDKGIDNLIEELKNHFKFLNNKTNIDNDKINARYINQINKILNKKLLESFWDSNNSKILAKELEKDYKKRVSPYRLISKLLND